MVDVVLLEKALGAYAGLAAGDALGATVEFMTEKEVAATYRVHRDIIGGGWLHLKPGQVTDDTQMALALGSAITAGEKWDLKRVAKAYVEWLRSGPMDVGNTVRRGLRRFISDGTLCGEPAESDGGNGAAMRNLPVILSTLWNEDLFYEQSLAQAHITHNHRLSDAGTIGLGALTRVMLLGGDMARVSRRVEAFVAEYPEFRYRPWPGRATGYIVDTVQTVLEAFFSTDNFEDCVVKAVNRGGDADTTGALAGQLAGAMYGIRSIPARWLRRIDPVVLDAIRKQTPALLEVARRTESVRNFTSPLILSEKGSWKS